MTVPGSEHIATVLARLDERTAGMAKQLDELRAVVVTQPEFKPVKAIVYGLVAIVLTSVFGALVALVVQKGG
jgi:hypothetical protein